MSDNKKISQKRKLETAEDVSLNIKEQNQKKNPNKKKGDQAVVDEFEKNENFEEEEGSELEFEDCEDDIDDEYVDEKTYKKIMQGNFQEDEEEWEDDGDDDDDENEEIGNEEEKQDINAKKRNKKNKNQKVEFIDVQQKPFMGTEKNLEEDEILDFDNKAYEMLHRANTEWPCLSCDFVTGEPHNINNPGFQEMKKYPYDVYVVAGTQSKQQNFIYLMRWSKLHKTKYDDDSDYQDDDEDDINNDDEPELALQSIQIKDPVNRIRAMQNSPLVAYWTENGDVTIADLSSRYDILNQWDPKILASKPKNNPKDKVFTKTFHNQVEGFALDWSPIKPGRLASGSCDGKIFIYNAKNFAFNDWERDQHPYVYHEGSVEDLQFSPVEEYSLASCSTDGTIRVVDLRVGNKKQAQLLVKAHECDVNVISWNHKNPFLIASGADDGCFKVWDLRYPDTAFTEIQYHQEPITSIQWQPNEESVLSVTSADNRLTIWDFSVENDENVEDYGEEIPDQLMFVHQGQQDMKELRYHPKYYEMIVSTAADGFHIFKPALNDEEENEKEKEDLENEDLSKIPKIKESDLNAYLAKMSLN
ncbi:histone-binding protein RBBP4 or subunit C of Caf1 complex protein (macronuclear) [Tetrahymena thermophila SB210]|uniref:Histone-binding protein RBBP4 or subunit C of Caf1 complex protein n=1 Tax=Tetrahymena thermophila (strain SB210) TaxID=312017 RepID=I7MAL7_TETTS|nr:histone-binding protein RBBP4 or subunit C of Caf1 complex protein [Tetrahymena thermophila SB210]EAS04841.1 histone-binding protein RBBP4 or subunit C of Caf1 complex protein [Tetrahymena thermophila SB210]|eukprot:XP_001025086.1 histone-binding protein RBBP4 or subunit C of Caf1 complex protein [Tetrahymena thermophila SB210]